LEIGDQLNVEAMGQGIRLLSNPGYGCLSIYGASPADFHVIDLAGRVVSSSSIEEGQQMNLELPPGLYMIVDRNSGMVLNRAIVL
jgi:hypothetical protein